MQGYELLYILKADAELEKVTQIKEKIIKVITGNGGSIVAEEDQGVRDLAAPMDKITCGRYMRIEFQSAPKVVAEVENAIKFEDALIRKMCVKLESIRNKASEVAA